jgi:regulator of protease activity HflC (stomatin/prohibitin superfamily)
LSVVFPCAWFCSCYSINENEHAVILQYGRFQGHETSAGIQCSNPCGRSVLKVSTKQISRDLINIKGTALSLLSNSVSLSLSLLFFFFFFFCSI